VNIQTKKIKNFTVLNISGKMLAENEYDFNIQVTKIISDDILHVVFDLAEVRVLTSYIIGVIIKKWKMLTARHGTLDIILENPEIKKIFHTLNLDSIIKIFDSEEQFVSAALSEAKEEVVAQIRQKGKYQILDVNEPLNIFVGYRELDNTIDTLFIRGHLFIALNLKEIVHIYSEVIGMMVKWQKKIKNAGGSFCVLNLKENLHERLKYLELDKFFDFRVLEEDL
jgi:anti-anti-sigma factor